MDSPKANIAQPHIFSIFFFSSAFSFVFLFWAFFLFWIGGEIYYTVASIIIAPIFNCILTLPNEIFAFDIFTLRGN